MTTEQDITNKLLSYQVGHVLQLTECLRLRNRVLDASDTGTGKTYCAIATCAILKLTPFIVCPKSVIPAWIEVCKIFNIKYLGISNYEMLKNSRYYTENYEPTKCPYMDVEVIITTPKINEEDNKKAKVINSQDITIPPPDKKKKVEKKFVFNFYLPADTLVIFDEAHRCKNWSSQTSSMLLGLTKSQAKIMLLSATISDKIDCFKPFGVVFGFYEKLESYKHWLRGKEAANKIKYKEWSETKIRADIIHSSLFPQFGSRLKIAELGGLFPQNNIIAQAYHLDDHDKIEAMYKEINLELEKIKALELQAIALAELIRKRQRIEMLKVTLFEDLAQEGLDSGFSVVIFVNYLATLEYLCHQLKVECVIRGGQTLEERQYMIEQFQQNKKNIMIVMIQAGGVGISLHDIHGGHPRMSIISPPWSGQDLKQALGRIHRAGSKTPAIQKIVYVAKTYEEKMCQIIKTKLTNIDAINDGTLDDVTIKLEEIDKIVEPENETKIANQANTVKPENPAIVIADNKPKRKYLKKKKQEKDKL
jgi:superfamily II DNA or RNA helicase